MKDKFILDACCGGRMFWENKKHPNTIYIDNRLKEKGHINQPGKITGAQLFGTLSPPQFTLQTTGSSVTFEHPLFVLDCGGPPQCALEFHIEIDASHFAVGGEISPISTSALLLAGTQGIMAWMIPVVVAAAGFGLVISRKL